MTTFKRTNLKIFTKPGAESTPDAQYWKKLGVPVLVKEFGPIDYIDFSPVEPHYFAVTCSVRVQLYNPITKHVAKNLSRFRETAYGGAFRRDGRLLCAGGEEAVVKLFDVESKALLRLFKGHTSAVHRCFFTADKTHIASFSDDRTVVLWDIPSEMQVASFAGHEDYVRAGAMSPVSSDILLSGGYDRAVHMFDARSNQPVFKVDHGAPVESVVFLPTGGVFLSAGGTEIRVWDALAGGRLLAKLSHHHKTVTCMCLASQGRRLLSGSLDRHVKIYDVATYQPVHTLDYPNAVLSLGVSAGDTSVVAGMVDGLVSVARRDDEVRESRQERRKVSYRFAADTKLSQSVDVVVPEHKMKASTKYDNCLRKFQYSKALDCVLAPQFVRKRPEATFAVCLELIRRKGLAQAMAGREDKQILTIIRFLIKYIGDARFTRVLIDVANIFLDVYDNTVDLSPEVVRWLNILAGRLKAEEDFTQELLGVQGAIQMLLSGASVGDARTGQATAAAVPSLEPSVSACSNFVVNLT